MYTWTEKKPLRMDRISELLAPSISANHFTNSGPGTRATEAYLHNRLKLPEDRVACLAASGTAALHTLVASFNIRRGRSTRWATQAMTFPSAVLGPLKSCIVVDNDATHYGPCMAALDRVAADIDGVIVTNMFGYLCHVNTYVEWCNAHGKLLIFDNAATPMSFISDTNACSVGDGAIISLHETKPWGRGEGGIIVCGAGEQAEAVYRAMNFGFRYGSMVRVSHCESSNWRMSDIAAVFIQSHLETLASMRAEDSVWDMVVAVDKYLQSCDTLEWAVPVVTDGSQRLFPACWFLRVRQSFAPIVVANFVEACAVDAKQYYLPLSDSEHAPVAWEWYSRIVCLPLHWRTGSPEEAVDLIRKLHTYIISQQQGT